MRDRPAALVFGDQLRASGADLPGQRIKVGIGDLLPARIDEQGVAGQQAVPGQALAAQVPSPLSMSNQLPKGRVELLVGRLFGAAARRGGASALPLVACSPVVHVPSGVH
jgi:hypothetical protein